LFCSIKTDGDKSFDKAKAFLTISLNITHDNQGAMTIGKVLHLPITAPELGLG